MSEPNYEEIASDLQEGVAAHRVSDRVTSEWQAARDRAEARRYFRYAVLLAAANVVAAAVMSFLSLRSQP